ncbi:type II toxin-antitoxin system RelE/ParE family toxin [Candidatus Peregrinibacteria bacterium]|nr:type II toxin-antitoxin system RelE/ParE family toxin [Candidatus Peregrinibacteria bacterium]
MNYKLFFTLKSKQDLAKIDKRNSKRIMDKLFHFCNSDSPMYFAKKLSNPKFGTFRYRIGNYRVLFDLEIYQDNASLIILAVKHRKEI